MPALVNVGHSNFCDLGFDVFGYKVSVMFCDDVARAVHELHPIIASDHDATALTYTYSNEARSEIFFPFTTSAETIAHEAFHAVWHMVEYVGMKKDNECMAYHLGHLVGEIVKAKKEAQEAKLEHIRNKELQNTGIFCCLL